MNVVEKAIDYRAFLEEEDQHGARSGFEPVFMQDLLEEARA